MDKDDDEPYNNYTMSMKYLFMGMLYYNIVIQTQYKKKLTIESLHNDCTTIPSKYNNFNCFFYVYKKTIIYLFKKNN